MMMYRLHFLLIVLITGCKGTTQEPGLSGDLPNVLLIITDDQGIGDIGYNGNPYIVTPHLDSLARAGIVLSNFYAAPVCSPSRASLLTGKYSLKTGVFDTYNGGAIMDADEVTLAEMLKERGYSTAMFGKWHLGDNYPFRPSDQGFDISLMHKAGGIGQPGDADNYPKMDSSYFDPVLYENDQPVRTSGYCSDVYTDALLDFLDAKGDRPFLAYLSFNAPHTPLQLPQSYYQLYDSLTFPEDDPQFLAGELSETQIEDARRVYGMVSNIDYNVGRVVAKLRDLQLMNETIIIFLSDNGPQQNRFRMGLRGLKTSVYEGGIKVPAFWYDGNLGSGEIKTTLSGMDLLPTLLDCLGMPIPDHLDGFSFKSILTDRETPAIFEKRPLYYHWQRGFPESYRNIAVRRGDYKLVGHGGPDMDPADFELYNLRDDPFERFDISGSNEGLVSDLVRQFNEWLTPVIKDKDLGYNRYIIGSQAQPQVVFTRNDARGIPAMWVSDDHFGFWDLQVASGGRYRVKITFRQMLQEEGRLLLRLAPFQKIVPVKQNGLQEFLVEDFLLEPGDYTLECGFQGNSGKWVFPFTISFELQGSD